MSVDPHTQETPPDYEDVVAEEDSTSRSRKTDNVNVAYEPDIDRIELAIEPEEGCKKDHVTGKSSPTPAASSSVTSSSVSSGEKTTDNQVVEALSAEEEKMLSVLRDVAQKCTNANPLKRPSAEQVLKMLQVINPYPDDYDDDADYDDDDVNVKYRVSKQCETKTTKEIAMASS
ncbi:uncharacterized protein LOC117343463 [Pecten maximus]|uniref:uncharacterized protein LOC117343463 n=1 Tax=Pecten maximus TaxID=6579 RepID=UPI001458AF34|nr:uncharacterized protein LOC117343463 [Pecten maximus]